MHRKWPKQETFVKELENMHHLVLVTVSWCEFLGTAGGRPAVSIFSQENHVQRDRLLSEYRHTEVMHLPQSLPSLKLYVMLSPTVRSFATL